MVKTMLRAKTMLWSVVILGLMFGWGARTVSAQETAGSSKVAAPVQTAPPPKTTAQESDNPLAAYHLDFSINEIEDGKKVNSRQYAMNLNSNSSNELKIGTRIPVESKEGEFQYLDVGTSIFSRLGERRGQTELEVRADVSSFANPEQEQGHARPLLRQLKINASTILLLGKPIVMGSVDDPNSRRQFQLEVTVTKLK
jgi:hypothetical protein